MTTLTQQQMNEIHDFGGAMASGLSESVKKMAQYLEKGIANAEDAYRAYAEFMGGQFRDFAALARQAEANALASKQGMASVYGNAADYYAREANKWLDPMIDARRSVNEFILQQKNLISNLDTMGAKAGKLLGPAVDAWNLGESWYNDGFGSEKSGQVAAGIVASAALGFIGGLALGLVAAGVGIVGLPAAIMIGAGAFIGAAWGAFQGELFFEWIRDKVDVLIPDSVWDMLFKAFDNIFDAVADLFDRAKQWVQPVDPIILDLNGNGLETVGLDANIYFDHDGDGVLTKTGWVGKDDALLVLDRNGNGLIDTGAELFGDFTPLPNGALAPNGFAALAAFDDNGDGIIDANDAIFSQLRLWRDSDQNGITGEGELITLEEAGIVGLNLGNTVKNQAMGNGNTLAREGSFIWADGSTGAM
ncbi:MAG: hypothetical protein FWF12_11950, partial [Betaproteobacteria bacterium]|nr:hypothetical protein [Betaproteobacteria bacterium]